MLNFVSVSSAFSHSPLCDLTQNHTQLYAVSKLRKSALPAWTPASFLLRPNTHPNPGANRSAQDFVEVRYVHSNPVQQRFSFGDLFQQKLHKALMTPHMKMKPLRLNIKMVLFQGLQSSPHTTQVLPKETLRDP